MYESICFESERTVCGFANFLNNYLHVPFHLQRPEIALQTWLRTLQISCLDYFFLFFSFLGMLLVITMTTEFSPIFLFIWTTVIIFLEEL